MKRDIIKMFIVVDVNVIISSLLTSGNSFNVFALNSLTNKFMSKLITILQGKKTYIVAVCIGIIAALQFLSIIPAEVAATLYGLLGAGGLATLRAGVSKK